MSAPSCFSGPTKDSGVTQKSTVFSGLKETHGATWIPHIQQLANAMAASDICSKLYLKPLQETPVVNFNEVDKKLLGL